MIYAVVTKASGAIVNRIVLDDIAGWPVPDGNILVPETGETLEIGGTVLAGVYAPPVRPLPPPLPTLTLDQIYDAEMQTQRVLKAVVMALNDGSMPIGQNRTAAQLKAAIKAKM